MSRIPHDLAEDFPEDRARIETLRLSDPHFGKLVEKYETINAAVHRAETGVERCDDLEEVQMRKTRMRLKDDIAAVLAKTVA